ncbi:hypothetical protein [Streptomyces sp. ALI-76-A]|nr:hypothetical protein [Streptomyces sp. ALI-76-A]MDL5204275.1 hypothetical protein [Streptomyces sp. ALI-76-A]
MNDDEKRDAMALDFDVDQPVVGLRRQQALVGTPSLLGDHAP